MKALLICPDERPEVALLAEADPLACVSILGKELIAHWLEHLASLGAKEVRVLAVDRPEKIRRLVGDGAKWGLRVEILPQMRELTRAEALAKFKRADELWLTQPSDVVVMDSLPGLDGLNLFDGYDAFFAALLRWLPQANSRDRIGLREVKPGVWIGLRSRVSASANLIAPCWIGENTCVAPQATIGPNAILENNVIVQQNATVTSSLVGSETFVGDLTELTDSIALGPRLINWRQQSATEVRDAFLLCSLRQHQPRRPKPRLAGRLAALMAMALTWPLALLTLLRGMLIGSPALCRQRAVLPEEAGGRRRTVFYWEFSHCTSFWRRWPQLWNIVRGEFFWVGNRPLAPAEAGKLANDFERLWLAAPVGIFSQADAAGCGEVFSDEAKAHASYFAVQNNRRLKLEILSRVLPRIFCTGPLPPPPLANIGTGKERAFSLDPAATS
jgi:hypothetical protein